MAAQLRHLVEMAQLPNVSIRVAPLDERAFIAPVGAFHIMSDAARVPFLACPTDLMGGPVHREPAYPRRGVREHVRSPLGAFQ
jgi:hypothetical protein